jgi:hypothetical protein
VSQPGRAVLINMKRQQLIVCPANTYANVVKNGKTPSYIPAESGIELRIRHVAQLGSDA